MIAVSTEDESNLDWPCYECGKRFRTSQDLQQHLSVHDSELGLHDDSEDRRNDDDPECHMTTSTSRRAGGRRKRQPTPAVNGSEAEVRQTVVVIVVVVVVIVKVVVLVIITIIIIIIIRWGLIGPLAERQVVMLGRHSHLPIGRVIPRQSISPGRFSSRVGTTRKEDKYVDLGVRYIFEPIAIETLGVFNASACQLLADLGTVSYTHLTLPTKRIV